MADEYRTAAHALLTAGQRGKPLRAPFCLSALHAIELYLNALLLHRGCTARSLRGLQHDFAKRAKQAADGGLVLRRRTAQHLATVAATREYVVTRYGPEMAAPASQVNRLSASLEEVAKKVKVLLAGPG
ncbi:hypothetical protein [Caulobacter sp. 17J80-11]|uniref:hypothetical protein n=1 Tax=Caulobacter sp. 17J80-11 TaxID=2763502 RepID=UPI001CA396D1|nr:hypothetical protein [Caulobacter sp. 17J80-11]